MRILMLNYEFPPLGGGAGNETYYFLKELAKHKQINVDLITSSTGLESQKKISSNISIYFLDIGKNEKNFHFQSVKDLLIYTFKAWRKSTILTRLHTYDLVHAWFGTPGGLIASFLPLPYIISLQGSDVPFYNPRFFWLDRLILKHLDVHIWGKAHEVVANSQDLKRLAQKTMPQKKIYVIPNGVDINEFSQVKKTAVKELKKIRLITVARLSPRKGVDIIIKALSILNKNSKYTGLHLTVAGDGSEMTRLKKLSKDLKVNHKVKFLGEVPHRQIPKLLQDADIFVLPSLNEGMSNAILEATASGLPIITTNTGGTKELINGNGIIIDEQNPKQLAVAIESFISHPALLAKMGRESRKLSESLSWGRMVRSYVKLYKLCAEYSPHLNSKIGK